MHYPGRPGGRFYGQQVPSRDHCGGARARCLYADEQDEAKATAPKAAAEAASAAAPGGRKAYFGAVHVHTSISFDAFTMGTRTMPEDAYRWARGEAMSPA